MHSKYAAQFLSHLKHFMNAHDLFPKNRALIAVSGGLDSMALLWCFHKIMPHKIHVLHLNHGTRSENGEEEELVQKFCEKNRIPFSLKRVQLNSQCTNFEAIAREERKRFFLEHAQRGDLIFTAHHLDDSFEWSLMQQFKSSNPEASLGIPLKNGKYARPFLCVSRKHISRLVKNEDISFREDPSNLNLNHERNFIRHQIIAPLKKRFPKYLKHYVHRQNQLIEKKEKRNQEIEVFKSDFGALFIHKDLKDDFLGARDELRNEIHRLSYSERGLIIDQLDKLIQSKKDHKKGPLSFSGGVKAYMETGLIYLTNQGFESRKFENVTEKMVQFNDCQVAYPRIFFTKNPGELEKKLPSLKKGDGVYEELKNELIRKGYYCQSLTKVFKALGKKSVVFGSIFPNR